MKPDRAFCFFKVFSSHMVLQREREIVFSGRGEPGKEFHVTFAGATRGGRVDDNGIWSVNFPSMPAGGPCTLNAGYAGEPDSVIFDDIMLGEVWMCTGQSNMEMPVWSDAPFWHTQNAEEEVKNGDHPNIRFFNSMFTRCLAPDTPRQDESGMGWERCTPESVAGFSACGYFFGRKLEQDMNVPIGLVATAWGGTDIEAWISPRKYEQCHWQVVKSENVVSNWPQMMADKSFDPLREWLQKFDQLGRPSPAMLSPDFDDSGWDDRTNRQIQLDEVGRYICRLTVDLPPDLADCDITVDLGVVNDVDESFFNGEAIGHTGIETASYWSVQRKYNVPRHLVKAGRNVIAMIADNHYCTGAIVCNALIVSGNNCEYTFPITARLSKLFAVPADFPPRPEVPSQGCDHAPTSPNYPSTLFNAMLNPWFKYAFRGVIWYQGCNNNGMMTYYWLHQMLIDDMREHWHNPDMPFLLVQLAAFGLHNPAQRADDASFENLAFPEYPTYAITREIQAAIPKVRSNVGMVTAFDRGDHSDIHPRDKQTIGLRLALKAEKMLGWRNDVCEGPEFDGFHFEGGKIRIFFRNTGSGLTTSDGNPPLGFVISGADGILYKANAVIEGDTVVVSNAAVFYPQRVRYAFTNYCRVNLINREGFPALPFRTDMPAFAREGAR